MQNQECEQKKIYVCQQWHAKTSMSMKRYKIPTGTPRRHIGGSVLAGGGVGADGGDDVGDRLGSLALELGNIPLADGAVVLLDLSLIHI